MNSIKAKPAASDLNILYSCRLRLTDLQRQKLKDAHNEFRRNGVSQAASTLSGSSISVATAIEPNQHAYQKFGLSSLIVNDIIVARESVALGVVLKLQELLGIQVISRKELETSFKGYLDHVYQS